MSLLKGFLSYNRKLALEFKFRKKLVRFHISLQLSNYSNNPKTQLILRCTQHRS